MKRKVSLIGPSTLMVSLPSKWVKKYNIKKGDEMTVLEDGDKLTVTSGPINRELSINLDSSDLGIISKHFINYLYQKGYDEIEIKFDSPDVFRQIQKSLSNLLGYEILNQTKNTCIIKSVFDSKKQEFDNILRRTFLILLDMAESCYDSVEKGEYSSLDEIRLLEKTNNKLTDFCKRTLSKEGCDDKSLFLYVIIRDIEKIADSYRNICDIFIANPKVTISKQSIALFMEVNSYLRLFYELFYKFDKNKAIILHDKKESMIKKAKKLFETKNKEESVLLHEIITLTQLIFDLYGPYITMNI